MHIFTTFYHFETHFTTSVEKIGVINIVNIERILYNNFAEFG